MVEAEVAGGGGVGDGGVRGNSVGVGGFGSCACGRISAVSFFLHWVHAI
jgi:hypothetical protein